MLTISRCTTILIGSLHFICNLPFVTLAQPVQPGQVVAQPVQPGQVAYPISSISSEIIVAKDLGKQLYKQNSFKAGTKFELDIDERFYYRVRSELVSDPSQILGIGCFVKKIECIIRFKDDVYGPYEVTAILSTEALGAQYSTTCRDLLKSVKNEVLDKLNSRNINDLVILLRGIWYQKNELPINCTSINQITSSDKRTDIFNIVVKKHGLLALVDVSPLSKDGTQFSLDIASGLFKNLARTSLDYVSVSGKPFFSNLMASVPFLKYEGRSWLSKNFEIEGVTVTSFEDSKVNLGYGWCIGSLGEKDKGIKTGMFWLEGRPNYFIGLSIRGVATWLSNYK